MSLLTHFIGHPFRLLASTLKIACFVHLTDSHLIQIAPAHGPSMLPTFPIEGISIVIDKTARQGRRVTVGDIVLYKIPLFPHQVGVKRIIGMPGDYVSLGTPGEAGEERMIQRKTHYMDKWPMLLPTQGFREGDLYTQEHPSVQIISSQIQSFQSSGSVPSEACPRHAIYPDVVHNDQSSCLKPVLIGWLVGGTDHTAGKRHNYRRRQQAKEQEKENQTTRPSSPSYR